MDILKSLVYSMFLVGTVTISSAESKYDEVITINPPKKVVASDIIMVHPNIFVTEVSNVISDTIDFQGKKYRVVKGKDGKPIMAVSGTMKAYLTIDTYWNWVEKDNLYKNFQPVKSSASLRDPKVKGAYDMSKDSPEKDKLFGWLNSFGFTTRDIQSRPKDIKYGEIPLNSASDFNNLVAKMFLSSQMEKSRQYIALFYASKNLNEKKYKKGDLEKLYAQ